MDNISLKGKYKKFNFHAILIKYYKGDKSLIFDINTDIYLLDI